MVLMGARRWVLRVAGVLGVVMSLCVFWSASAVARRAYTYTGTFGAAGTGAGELEAPQSVAVNDQTGNVYVVDTHNFRVEEFDSAGNFVLMFGSDVNKSTNGDVCTAAESASCQAGTKGWAGNGQFEAPTEVAVDNACYYKHLTGAECEAFDPSNGDVYVLDTGTESVYKFGEDGQFISTNTGSASPSGPFREPQAMTVDSSGRLWVQQKARMFEFEPNGSAI